MASSIIVPLDGSSFSEIALPTAFKIARAWNAEIEVVMVHEPVPMPGVDYGYGLWEQRSMEWAEEYLAQVVARIKDEVGLDVASALLVGLAAEALERHAHSKEADLVVMTSHGRGPLSRMWLGSVTDRFVRRTSTPVLIVRPEEGEEPDLSKEITFERVLIPVDGSEEGDAILGPALALGKACGSNFVLLHVSGYAEEFAPSYLHHGVRINPKALEEQRKKAEEDIDARVERLRAEGVEVTGQVVLDNSPSNGVLQFAAEHDLDVIAMATHGRGRVSRMFLGSVTDKVLRGAHHPVLVCRPPGESAES
jgi:nucleotide-binding universal stress UspA family protein